MRKTDTSELFASYPHLARIDELWGTRDCREFIVRLMNDTREGSRRGFPGKHARTILRLLIEHDQRFPEFEENISMIWHDVDGRQVTDA